MGTLYFDFASTCPLDKRVLSQMKPYFFDVYGNPSSLHREGRRAKAAIAEARQKIADILNCEPGEIIFTGSGTESDNLAVLGAALANKSKGNHIITSQIEHNAVLKPFKKLEEQGFKVTYIPVGRQGIVDIKDVAKAINKDTILISIMYANNEIGTLQPIQKIGSFLRKKNPKIIFHTDACQAAGYLTLDVKKLGCDLLTLNGSKIYGPKGIGVLYVKKGIILQSIVSGGGQERGLRSGTENISAIVGIAKALELSQKQKRKETARLTKLRDYFIDRLTKEIPKTILNGHPFLRLPNNVNVSFLDVEGEAILLWLDKYGICASTGSACDSRSLEPSHVILSLGRPYEYAHGSIRFSLGRGTVKKDIDFVMKVLLKIIKNLRAISPVKVNMSVGRNQRKLGSSR